MRKKRLDLPQSRPQIWVCPFSKGLYKKCPIQTMKGPCRALFVQGSPKLSSFYCLTQMRKKRLDWPQSRLQIWVCPFPEGHLHFEVVLSLRLSSFSCHLHFDVVFILMSSSFWVHLRSTSFWRCEGIFILRLSSSWGLPHLKVVSIGGHLSSCGTWA